MTAVSLPPEIERIRRALPAASIPGITLGEIERATRLPFDVVREGLLALRDQGLARRHTNGLGYAWWSAA